MVIFHSSVSLPEGMIYIYQIFIPKLWPSTNKEDDDEPKPRVFEWMRKMLFLVQFLEIG
jgi:hypothetical protein